MTVNRAARIEVDDVNIHVYVDGVNTLVHVGFMANTTRPYHHGDLRTALIAEAATMIAEGGAGSVTMRALGRRLEVSRAAAYRHFADKGALMVAVAASGFERLSTLLEEIDAGSAGDSPDRLPRMGEAYVRFALENPAYYRLMYGREALARVDVPELREAANALFDGLVGVFLVQQRAGVIRRQDPRAQAYVAWGAAHGLASLLIDGQILTAVDVDRLIQQMGVTLMEGLRAR
jgi:AcrR family transcriptional regulator